MIKRLPHPRTILRHIEGYKCAPGLNQEFFELLRIRMEGFSEIEKNISISFDEIKVSDLASYNSHLDETFGPNMGKVQVVQIRGIIKGFRQIVYYNFNTNMNLELLKTIISRIEAVGGKVRNCAFDLGNKTIVKDLKIGRDGYYFESPTREGAIIHGYPDPVHLLKLIRNHTLDSVMEVMIDGRKTTVSKEDLVKLTNLDAPAYEIRA